MYIRNSGIITGAALLMVFAALYASADSDSSETPQSSQPAQAASRLQVTGTRRQFSIEADHADVQSALKAIFVQAGKQFDLSNSVAGQFTLKLDNQPLDTVLSSLCGQTFLKCHQDTLTGIYHFEQDTAAEKAAFARIDTLNMLLRKQLHDLGLDLPGDVLLGGVLNKANAGASAQSQNPVGNSIDGNSQRIGNTIGGGGGGRDATGANTQSQKTDSFDKASAPTSQGGRNYAQNGVAAKSARGAGSESRQVGAGVPSGTYKDVELDTGNVPDYPVEQILQAYGMTANRQSGINADKAVENYLRQNNLVAINTHGVALPVSDVLAELSRQSGVPILLDPMVPRGARFRINLSLPACSLDEALKLILPPARLQSRIVNNHIYVTPTPEFQIFFGSAPVPYFNFPYNSTGSRPTQNGQQGTGQSGGLGGGQAPGQNGNPK